MGTVIVIPNEANEGQAACYHGGSVNGGNVVHFWLNS